MLIKWASYAKRKPNGKRVHINTWVKHSHRKQKAKLMLSLLGLSVPSLRTISVSCCLRRVLLFAEATLRPSGLNINFAVIFSLFCWRFEKGPKLILKKGIKTNERTLWSKNAKFTSRKFNFYLNKDKFKILKNSCLDIVAMVAPNLLNYDMLQQILPR